MIQTISKVDDEEFARRILERPLVGFATTELRAEVAGRRVLVTGAGGFIGSALAQLVARLEPERITLADNGELALYEIDRHMRAIPGGPPIGATYCDIRDRPGLARMFETERPDVVLHAAALKQLPMLEAHPREAVLTNVLGTANLVECCLAGGVAALVHISTDKAAAPVSVLGASKRAAEAVCQAADGEGRGVRFSSVRFSNVFGSTGSVVALFLDQIAKGEPLTITHPAMRRHFMTAAEAAQLVLRVLSLSLAEEAPRRAIYMLEAGSSLPIVTLAQRILEFANQPDAQFRTISTRPGEKLEETLLAPWERAWRTAVEQISCTTPNDQVDDVRALLPAMRQACERCDDGELRNLLMGFAAPAGLCMAEAVG